MHNRKRKNMFIMIAAICTIMIMTTGYAVLTQIIKVNGTITVERDWDVRITGITDGTPTGAAANELAPAFDDTTATFSALLYNKGDSMTYKITVENFGSWDAQLNTMTLTDSGNPAVKFTVSGVAEGDTLMSGSTHEITVKVEYDSTYEGEIESNVGTLTINLTYGQAGSGSIDTGGDEPSESTASMLIAKAVTSGDGLYTDPVESNRYVYRGADPDNYIWLDLNGDTAKTDNETYRIMSVEADNTIKVVAQNSLGNMAWDAYGNRTASGYCTDTYCNAWGSSTTTLDTSGNNVTVMPREAGSTTTYALPSNEASLNTYLNTTFLNSIDSDLQNKIATHTFNIGPLKYESGQTLATDISQESAYKWSGKIALINPTDYVRASTNSACTSVYEYVDTSNCYNNSTTHNYLFYSQKEWTMSPLSDSSSTDVWDVYSDGIIGSDSAEYSKHGVWPSFYLISDISLSGEGTLGVPYEIG